MAVIACVPSWVHFMKSGDILMFKNGERFVIQAVSSKSLTGLFVDAEFVSHRDLMRIRMKMALLTSVDEVAWSSYVSPRGNVFTLEGRRRDTLFPLFCDAVSATMPDGMPACVSCETVEAMADSLRGTPSYQREIWPVLRRAPLA